MDFISTYMPTYAELSAETIKDTRSRLESFIRMTFPEQDMQPGTVLGDLILTPQAFTLSAVETGMDRFMSDLDLGNVANGIIYNCDFVERYLNNFAASTDAALQGSGTLRLVFSDNKTYVLDRSTRFKMGEDTYGMYMPHEGPVTVYPVGSQMNSEENCVRLHDTGSGTFFADLPVVCLVSTRRSAVEAGATAMINKVIPELGAITAIGRFTSGEVSFTLPELAKRTRNTIYAASLNSRNGAIRYAWACCPFVDGAYAVKSGDREMLREFRCDNTPMACLDMFVRSAGYEFTEQQTVTLKRVEGVGGGYYWVGEWDYTGQPYHFESITNTGTPQVADLPHVVVSTTDTAQEGSSDPSLGGLSTYSRHERLFLIVEDSPDFDYSVAMVDGKVTRTANFTVTYQTDPMHRAIAETIETTDNRPVNVSTLTRGFIPVIIDKFEVEYVKKQGVLPLLSEAEDNIKIYLGNLAYPDVFSDACIADIMYAAGAKYMKQINVKARVQWSVGDVVGTFKNANDVTPSAVTDPGDKFVLVNPECTLAAAYYPHDNLTEAVDVVDINSSADLRVSYPNDAADADDTSMFACSVRNIRYYLMEGALTFKEVKEVQ